MRISDWSSDVCSSDLPQAGLRPPAPATPAQGQAPESACALSIARQNHSARTAPAPAAVQIRGHAKTCPDPCPLRTPFAHVRRAFRVLLGAEGKREIIQLRSEEHTSELQSLMRNSYAVFCLKKKKNS